jgi:hypothetical protein
VHGGDQGGDDRCGGEGAPAVVDVAMAVKAAAAMAVKAAVLMVVFVVMVGRAVAVKAALQVAMITAVLPAASDPSLCKYVIAIAKTADSTRDTSIERSRSR